MAIAFVWTNCKWQILYAPAPLQSTNFVSTIFKLRARSFYVHLSWSVCLSVGLCVGLSVCLSVKKIKICVENRNLIHIWKQKAWKGISWHQRWFFIHFDLLELLKWSQTTHISNQTYSQPHIPGALCSTLVALVL